ncbi:hypothetical protein GX48_05794 [Paracoccidioides brasiliensis]|nr:hypothetical protein GX48_05794 [Paracoccidioides brasiliensis]
MLGAQMFTVNKAEKEIGVFGFKNLRVVLAQGYFVRSAAPCVLAFLISIYGNMSQNTNHPPPTAELYCLVSDLQITLQTCDIKDVERARDGSGRPVSRFKVLKVVTSNNFGLMRRRLRHPLAFSAPGMLKSNPPMRCSGNPPWSNVFFGYMWKY